MMKKLLSKGAVLLLLAVGLFSWQSSDAQCINTSLYPAFNIPVIDQNSTPAVNISTCNFTTGEYSEVVVNFPGVYTFSVAGNPGYVTITDALNNVIGHGPSPYPATIAGTGTYRAHWTDDAACAGALNCVVTSVEFTAFLGGCIPPLGITAGSTGTTTATISWPAPSSAPANGYEYVVSTTSTAPTGSGTATTTPSAAITGLMASTQYFVFVRSMCATDTSIWNGPASFYTGFAPPYLQDFNGTTFPPGGWSVARGTAASPSVVTPGTSDWFSAAYENAPTGSPSARMNIWQANENDWLISPNFDLGSGPHNWGLIFDAAGTEYFSSTQTAIWGVDDSLKVLYSTDGGVTWNRSNSLFDFNSTNPLTLPGATYSTSLSTFTGTIQFAFYAESTISNEDIHVFVENFRVDVPPACGSPTLFSATGNNSPNSVELGWTPGTSGAFAWLVEYGAPGFVPGTGAGTVVGAFSNPYTVTGLTASTSYDFYVREFCQTGTDTSFYSGPVSVTTLCNAFTIPFVENFDGSSWSNLFPGASDPCWGGDLSPNSTFSSNRWVVGTTQTFPGTSGPSADHTTGAGNYLYSEYNFATGLARVETPQVDLTGAATPAVAFYFHAYGSGIGTTYIEVNDGSGWVVVDSLVGQYQSSQGEAWFYHEVSLLAYANQNVQIGWSADMTTFDSRFAIDDVLIGNGSPCPLPNALSASAIGSSSIDVSWNSIGGGTSWNVAYGLPGFSPDSAVGSANGPIGIIPATSTTSTFTGLMGGTQYHFFINEACSTPGTNSFWAGPVSTSTAIAPPYLQDFDNGYPPNDGWTEGYGILGEPTVFTSSSSNWFQDTYENVPSGSPSARTNLFSSNFFEWMFSPSIDLGAPGHNWELTWDGAATEYGLSLVPAIWGPGDSLIIVVSTDNGATWNRSNQIAAYHIGNPLTAPGSNYAHSLAAYSGVIKIGYYGTTQGTLSTEDIDVFVDNFSINIPPACPNVSFVSCTGVSTTTSIEVGWTDGTVGATSWEIEYGPAGFAPGTGTVVTATSNPFNVTGLSPSTSYDFYVREQCANGVDFSNWVGTATCNTDCAPIAAPWSDSFEGNSISQCWVNDPTDQIDWTILSGATGSVGTGPSAASDGTYYIYVETSPVVAGNKARITTPQLDATGLFFPALSFDYHQYGAGMGWFRVFAMNPATSTMDTLFAQYGDQGNQWNSLIISLTGYANSSNVIEVMFELEVDDANGFAYENDLALDNFVYGEDPTFVQSCDNFDAYTAGNLDAQSTDWNSWGGAAGTEDAEVTAEQAQSAPHSLKIHDSGTNSASDIVYSLGDKTADSHELTFSFYQPAANGGYFNLMHQYSPPATYVFAIEVLLDGPAGTGTIDYGSSGGGSIGTFSFVPDAWNDVQFIIDLDTDTARMNVNGVSVATWQWSDGQGGVYENLGAMDLYSTAPGTLTPLIYIDDMCYGRYAPPCVVNTVPTTSDITSCEGQPATLTATPGGSSSFPVWSNAAGNIIGSGTPFNTDTLFADETFSVRDGELLGGQLKVGPTPDIATAGFGNFGNGLYITVNRAIRLDSITLRSDGAIDVGVNLYDAPAGTLLQTSKQINIAAAGDHQVSVDMVIAPGSYFINMRYDGGTGALFRATGGATFPYVIPDILSLDSINFSNQIRFYYLFEWVVNEVCLAGATVDADVTMDPAPTAAFSLNQGGGGMEVVDFDASGSSSDAVSYDWDFGDSNTGTGATTQHTYAAAGQYTVTLTVTDACGNTDVTTQTIDVTIGLAENPVGTTVALYPNPTRDIANLSFEVMDVQDIEVHVMNAMGQVIYTESLPKFTGVYNNTINLSSEAKGVYFVQIVTRDGLINRRISLQ